MGVGVIKDPIFIKMKIIKEQAKQEKFDKLFIDVALRVAEMSHAQRRKVGAILVKDGRIISMGYNGTPPKFDNACEYIDQVDEMYTKPEVLHAEMNCIGKVARSTESAEGATLYLTCSPCFECAKLLLTTGISRVVYKDDYRRSGGISLLKLGNVRIEQI